MFRSFLEHQCFVKADTQSSQSRSDLSEAKTFYLFEASCKTDEKSMWNKLVDESKFKTYLKVEKLLQKTLTKIQQEPSIEVIERAFTNQMQSNCIQSMMN